jgi:hypothetical protein
MVGSMHGLRISSFGYALLALSLYGVMAAASCQALLGLDDPTLRSDGGSAAGGSSTGGTAGAGGGVGGSSIGGRGGSAGAVGCPAFPVPGAHLWSHTLGGQAEDVALAVAYDAGTIAVVGATRSPSVDLGGSQNVPANDDGFQDAFVAWYAADGSFRNNLVFTGDGDQLAKAVAVRGNRIYVAGDFENTIVFDQAAQTSRDAVPTDTPSNGFVVALDEVDGGIEWTVRLDAGAGTGDWLHLHDLAVDDDGAVWVAGEFRGNLHVEGEGGGPSVPADNRNAFVARIHHDKTVLHRDVFRSSTATNGRVAATAIAPVPGGEYVVVAGEFAGEVEFPGGATLGHVNVTNESIWLVRLAASSNYQEDPVPSTGYGLNDEYEKPSALAIHASGATFMTGRFQGDSVTFGNHPVNREASLQDAFVVGLDEVLTPQWAEVPGEGEPERLFINDVAVDLAESFVLVGEVHGDSKDFGGGLLDGVVGSDPFVAKFESDRAHRFSWQLADDYSQAVSIGTSVAIDECGRITVVGGYRGTTAAEWRRTTGTESIPLDNSSALDLFITQFAP